MSRKSKRLRAKVAKLTEEREWFVDSSKQLAEWLARETARADRLERELARWKPRLTVEYAPDMKAWALKYYVMADVLRYARDPRAILDATFGDLRAKLEDAIRSGFRE